jgi:hypothetical protein
VVFNFLVSKLEIKFVLGHFMRISLGILVLLQ